MTSQGMGTTRARRQKERWASAAAWLVLSGSLLVLHRSAVRAQQPTSQEPPRFRSSVEVTSLDVTVVDDRGRPIADLQPGDFNVRIDGNPRQVISAEWISLVGDTADDVL